MKKYAFKKIQNTDDSEEEYEYEILYSRGLGTLDISENPENATTDNTTAYKILTEDNLQEILNHIFKETIEENKLHVSKWEVF